MMKLANKEDPYDCISNDMLRFSNICESLHLEFEDLISTCVIAKQSIPNMTERNTTKVHMWGDGAFIYKRKTSDLIFILDREYSKNAPFYPIYEKDYETRQKYINIEDNIDIVTIYAYNSYTNSIEAEVVRNEKASTPLHTSYYDDLELGVVVSDGIWSVESKNDDKQWLIENVAKEIVNFKTTKGVFLQRRVGKMLKRLNKNGFTFFDDLSISGFVV
jgi:hypothetical protein